MPDLTYLSVCSGIEAASVAWHGLGWTPVAFSEIDPFASALLAARFPDVPNLGNMKGYNEWTLPQFDVLVGGTPCQSFSVAGLRKGLDDPRGNLALVYLGILDRFRPRWCVWENVPGVLSSSGGRDFGAFLGALAQLGYGFAYRVLDAQYVRVESHPRAVPQRRRRVFVVGCAGGDWRSAAEVLLEPEGVRGDPPTRGEARQNFAGCTADGARSPRTFVEVAGTLGGASQSGGFRTTDLNTTGAFVGEPQAVVGFQSNSDSHSGDVFEDLAPTLRLGAASGAVPPAVAFSCKDYGGDTSVEFAPTLRAMPHAESHANGGGQLAVAFKASHYTRGKDGAPAEVVPPLSADADKGDQDTLVAAPVLTLEVRGREGERVLEYRADGTANALRATDGGRDGMGVGAIAAPSRTASNDPSSSPQSSEVTQQVAAVHAAPMEVRRLTPRECERLQGFPDDWTLIDYKGKPAADSPRYKALGNSMAVNVMRWIGARIDQHASKCEQKGAGRPATGRTRKGTSISLSDAERERLARWGETTSAAVRRVLAVAEAAEQRGDATP